MNNPIDFNEMFKGSAQSPELTDKQSAVADLFTHFGKVAVMVASTPVQLKVEKPSGLQRFLEQKKRIEERTEKPMSPEALKKLQDEAMYDYINDASIGNSTAFLQTMLVSASSNKTFQNAVTELVKEAVEISNKKTLMRRSTEVFNPKDNL